MMINLENKQLGHSRELISLETREENLLASQHLIRQTNRNLDIFSRTLDPFIYDHSDCVQEIKKLAISNRHALIRILIAEPGPVIRRGHRLVDLAMNLSSYIHIRIPSRENKDFNDGLMIADKTAYLHKKNDTRYEAKVNFHDPRQSKELTSTFEDIWETAKPDPNLRRLAL